MRAREGGRATLTFHAHVCVHVYVYETGTRTCARTWTRTWTWTEAVGDAESDPESEADDPPRLPGTMSMAGHLIPRPTPIGNLGDLNRAGLRGTGFRRTWWPARTRGARGSCWTTWTGEALQRFDDHAGEAASSGGHGAWPWAARWPTAPTRGCPASTTLAFELARLVAEAGAEVTWLPGPSAVLLAGSGSGLPSHAFSFLGYLPSRARPAPSSSGVLGREETTCSSRRPTASTRPCRSWRCWRRTGRSPWAGS